MKNFLITIISFLLFLNIVFGQESKTNFSNDNNFRGKNAWLIDSVLCSKDFEGRKSGFAGAEKAAKFISEKFNEWGLKPKGDNKTFFQKFPLLVTEETAVPELIIKNARRGEIKLQEGDDFALFTNSGSAVVESDVIFAGYGLCDSCWNDYKNLDVKGKIVLMIGGSPENKNCNLSHKDDRNSKFKIACDHGAAGVLVWSAPGTRAIKGAAILEQNYNKNVPGAYVLDWVVRELFKGTGKSFDEIQNKLKTETQSFSLNKKVLFDVKMKEIENGFGENVVGMIEGKEKKDEYIIFGAHMDHLGKSANGYIYPGADDNGSGASLVMELSRVLSKQKNFKRNIVFICFGAEEQGLLGSNYFVNYPTVPKDKIAMMFNFDMVGVGDGGIGISGVETLRKYWYKFYDSLTKEEKNKIKTGRAGVGGTDHTGFKLGGIPALSSASNGMHKFYHVPDDSYDYVDSTVFQSIGSIVEKFALFIGNYDENIIHKYRNEKNLFDGCNITGLNTPFEIIDVNREANIKSKLMSGIKIMQCSLDGNDKDKNSDIGKYITLSEKMDENVTLVINSDELKKNNFNSNMVIFPAVKNFNGNKDQYNILSKLGFNYFDYTNQKPSESVLKVIKNSWLQSDITNAKFISENINDNHLIIKDGFKEISKALKKINDNEYLKKAFYILSITETADADDINDVIKTIGIRNVHLDISGLLEKNENEVYETLKKLKLLGYSDDNIRSIFGENFVNMF